MTKFSKSFYLNNYDIFKDCRTLLDAVILTKYLKWNTQCKTFLEIGVEKGASFSIVFGARPDVICYLIDPDFSKFKKNIPEHFIKNAIFFQTKSNEMNWEEIPIIDFVLLDGDPKFPTPVNDAKAFLNKVNDNSIIALSWVHHPDTHHTRKYLKDNGWTRWIKLDNSEWWAKKDLQPFIDHVIHNDAGLLKYSRIIKANSDNDFKWEITAPQFVYDNVELVKKYIQD